MNINTDFYRGFNREYYYLMRGVGVLTESYLEYCIENCEDTDIAIFSDIYKTKKDLFNAAKQGFNGCDDILGQGNIIIASKSVLLDEGLVCYENFNRDTRKLYDRFVHNISKLNDDNSKRIDVDKDFLFDTLVDLNWLISSLFKPIAENSVSGEIALIVSYPERCIWLKKALNILYNTALRDKETGEHYKEAHSGLYTIFTGAIPYREVKDYIVATNATSSDLIKQERHFYNESIEYMALYYALITTAAVYERIRKNEGL